MAKYRILFLAAATRASTLRGVSTGGPLDHLRELRSPFEETPRVESPHEGRFASDEHFAKWDLTGDFAREEEGALTAFEEEEESIGFEEEGADFEEEGAVFASEDSQGDFFEKKSWSEATMSKATRVTKMFDDLEETQEALASLQGLQEVEEAEEAEEVEEVQQEEQIEEVDQVEEVQQVEEVLQEMKEVDSMEGLFLMEEEKNQVSELFYVEQAPAVPKPWDSSSPPTADDIYHHVQSAYDESFFAETYAEKQEVEKLLEEAEYDLAEISPGELSREKSVLITYLMNHLRQRIRTEDEYAEGGDLVGFLEDMESRADALDSWPALNALYDDLAKITEERFSREEETIQTETKDLAKEKKIYYSVLDKMNQKANDLAPVVDLAEVDETNRASEGSPRLQKLAKVDETNRASEGSPRLKKLADGLSQVFTAYSRADEPEDLESLREFLVQVVLPARTAVSDDADAVALQMFDDAYHLLDEKIQVKCKEALEKELLDREVMFGEEEREELGAHGEEFGVRREKHVAKDPKLLM